MVRKKKRFRIFTMLLSSLISNCLCFSSKGYKNYDKRKIGGVNYYRKKKKKFNVRRSKKSNLVRNAVVTSGVGIGLTYLGKKYFVKDSTVKSDDISEPKLDKREKIDKIQGEVNLNDADKEYIRRNFFLCAWENNSCWNDVAVQFFMCPDVRRGKYNSKAIMTTLNYINDVLRQKYNGDYLGRKVKVPKDKRPFWDILDDKSRDNRYFLYKGEMSCAYGLRGVYVGLNTQELGLIGHFIDIADSGVLDATKADKGDIKDPNVFKDKLDSENLLKIDKGKYNDCVRHLIGIVKTGNCNLNIMFFENMNFFPTFIQCLEGSNHFVSYYVIYNKQKQVKYFLRMNGMAESMVVLSKNLALEQIGKSREIDIVYTKSDIVEEYYTP